MEQRYYDVHAVVNYDGRSVADEPLILSEAQTTEFLRLWQSYHPSVLQLTIRPIIKNDKEISTR